MKNDILTSYFVLYNIQWRKRGSLKKKNSKRSFILTVIVYVFYMTLALEMFLYF
jgi:hypothetical protein